jgi:hypothetical protein
MPGPHWTGFAVKGANDRGADDQEINNEQAMTWSIQAFSRGRFAGQSSSLGSPSQDPGRVGYTGRQYQKFTGQTINGRLEELLLGRQPCRIGKDKEYL